MDTFYQRAYAMISSKEAREAFNLAAESDALKEKYGKNSAGMRMLMARRLVEAGVRFVSLTYGGWDHHTGISKAMNGQMPSFDKAFAALIRRPMDSRSETWRCRAASMIGDSPNARTCSRLSITISANSKNPTRWPRWIRSISGPMR